MRLPTRSRTATALLLVTASCWAATAARAEAFGVRPGAWEMTTTRSGNTIPPDALAKIPPERRAMIEQRMAQGNAQTRKSCVKKEDLESDRVFQRQDSGCTLKTVTRTSTKLVLSTTCTGDRAATSTISFEAKTPESVVGSIEVDSSGSKFHIGIVGKWLGASCDGIEPMRGR